jgi:hypothetical protein
VIEETVISGYVISKTPVSSMLVLDARMKVSPIEKKFE